MRHSPPASERLFVWKSTWRGGGGAVGIFTPRWSWMWLRRAPAPPTGRRWTPSPASRQPLSSRQRWTLIRRRPARTFPGWCRASTRRSRPSWRRGRSSLAQPGGRATIGQHLWGCPAERHPQPGRPASDQRFRTSLVRTRRCLAARAPPDQRRIPTRRG